MYYATYTYIYVYLCMGECLLKMKTQKQSRHEPFEYQRARKHIESETTKTAPAQAGSATYVQ